MEQYTINVNGKEHTILSEPNWTLLHVLREVMDITSVKPGCLAGDCGACKVVLDGEAVNACTQLMKKVDGKTIVTSEGISGENGLHPIQQAFVDKGGLQCGYCTPGFVVSSYALLEKNPEASKDEILDAIDNNICRCTGYVKIVEAIEEAQRVIRGEKDE